MSFFDGGAGAILGGGISALGGIFGNRSAAKEAAKARAFQQKTMKRRIRWTVKDMKAAGLNPMLAVSGAISPPGTPSAAVASQGNPLGGVGSDARSLGGGLGRDQAGATRDKAEAKKTGRLMDAQLEALQSQAANNAAQANAAITQSRLNSAKELYEQTRAITERQNWRRELLLNQAREAAIPSAVQRGKFDESTIGRFINQFGRAWEQLPLGRGNKTRAR